MPMAEDERTKDCSRLKLRAENVYLDSCFDRLVEEMNDGFLSTSAVIGVELKRKGTRNVLFIWIKTDAVEDVRNKITE